MTLLLSSRYPVLALGLIYSSTMQDLCELSMTHKMLLALQDTGLQL